MNDKIIEAVKQIIKRLDNEVIQHEPRWRESSYPWFFHNYNYPGPCEVKWKRDIVKVKYFCKTINKIYNIYGKGKFND